MKKHDKLFAQCVFGQADMIEVNVEVYRMFENSRSQNC